jgi:Protein of unknown function (DUF4231)
MDQPITPTTTNEDNDFSRIIKKLRTNKEKEVDPQIQRYKSDTFWPHICFRCAGVLTILLSVTLPALAASSVPNKEIVLSVMSISIAALTSLGSFFRWERTWRGNTTALIAIEQHCAKWELELANAELKVPSDERITHVYLATSDLLANVRSVAASQSEGFLATRSSRSKTVQPRYKAIPPLRLLFVQIAVASQKRAAFRIRYCPAKI